MGIRENNPLDNLLAEAAVAAEGLAALSTKEKEVEARTYSEMPEILIDMTDVAKETLEKGDIAGWNKAKMEKELDNAGFKVTIKIDNLNINRQNLSNAPALDLDNCLLADPKITESTFSAISLNGSRILENQTAYITNNRIGEIDIRGLKIETSERAEKDIRGSVRFNGNKYGYIETDGNIPTEMQDDVSKGYVAPKATTFSTREEDKDAKKEFNKLVVLKEKRNNAWHDWDEKSALEKGIINTAKAIGEAVKDSLQGGPGSDGINHNSFISALTPCTFNGGCSRN